MTTFAITPAFHISKSLQEANAQPAGQLAHHNPDISKIVGEILGFCEQASDLQLESALTMTFSEARSLGMRRFVPTIALKDVQFIPSTTEVQRIYIVRHGESVLNVPNEQGIKLVSGQSNHAPLTAKGIKQAQKLGKALAERIPAHTEIVICSSTAERAKKTAGCIYEILSTRFTTCVQGDTHSGLCELSKGKYEGLPKKSEEEEVKRWEQLPAVDKFRTPIVETGESYCDVVQRSLDGLQTLSEKYAGKTLIVVAHGRIFQGFYMQWTGKIRTLSSKIEPLTDFLPNNCDILMAQVGRGDRVSAALPSAYIQFTN